jgi:hypothetical protein
MHTPAPGALAVLDLNWSVCPLDLLQSPFFTMVEALERLAKVSPLAGWPDRYAPWAVDGLLALRTFRGEL